MKYLIGKEQNIELFVEKNYEAMSQKAAALLVDSLANKLQEKQFVTFMPSAGGTPERLYQILGEKYKTFVDWSRVIVLQMDEYVDLPAFDKNSYTWFLHKKLVKPLSIQKAFFIGEYAQGRVQQYDEIIRNLGGIDIILHGIGENGHLGFNEPESDYDSTTRIVALAPETIHANARFFSNMETVPTRGITIGLRTIMQAGENILIASGVKKLPALTRALFAPVSVNLPASILQNHPHVKVIADEDAVDIKLLKAK